MIRKVGCMNLGNLLRQILVVMFSLAKTGLAVAIFVSVGNAVSADESITPTVGPSFDIFGKGTNEYFDSVTVYPDCDNSGSLPTSCDHPIQKRVDDYFIGIFGSPPDPKAILYRSLQAQLQLTLSEINSITGLHNYTAPNGHHKGAIFIVFVDIAAAIADPHAYFRDGIEKTYPYNEAAVEAEFDSWVIDRSNYCKVLTALPSDGIIKISSIWVKPYIPNEFLKICILASLVSAFGIDVDLQDLQIGSFADTENGPVKLPLKYADMLRIQYSELIQAGMTRDEVRRRLGMQ